MANLMLHNLTGGAWGGAVRPAFIASARLVPLAALLGLPVLIGMRELYPIAEGGWFGAPFFAARSVAYLLVWSALGFFVRTSVALSSDGRRALVGAPDDNGGAGAAVLTRSFPGLNERCRVR